MILSHTDLADLLYSIAINMMARFPNDKLGCVKAIKSVATCCFSELGLCAAKQIADKAADEVGHGIFVARTAMRRYGIVNDSLESATKDDGELVITFYTHPGDTASVYIVNNIVKKIRHRSNEALVTITVE